MSIPSLVWGQQNRTQKEEPDEPTFTEITLDVHH